MLNEACCLPAALVHSAALVPPLAGQARTKPLLAMLLMTAESAPRRMHSSAPCWQPARSVPAWDGSSSEVLIWASSPYRGRSLPVFRLVHYLMSLAAGDCGLNGIAWITAWMSSW
jgi:hypothetical protein